MSSETIAAHVAEVHEQGYTVIEQLIDAQVIDQLAADFDPMLNSREHADRYHGNRGPCRHYITLPLTTSWAVPDLIDNDVIFALMEALLGADCIWGEFASDTPLAGSVDQDVHRDAGDLFPAQSEQLPSFQIAVNIPLVDVTPENGPLEIAGGTHRWTDTEASARLQAGEVGLKPVLLKRGDILVRDVRALHRGTSNRRPQPRPVLALGYQRRWLKRADVRIATSCEVWSGLSPRVRLWLRHGSVFESMERAWPEPEQTFTPAAAHRKAPAMAEASA